MTDSIAAHRIPINIADEMRQSYMDYAMSVIIGRALPDVRDGLKPANRRVLFGMQAMGLQPGRPHRKCAKIVGEVMGNYHPHGDAAIYDTLVRMAQDFNLRALLAQLLHLWNRLTAITTAPTNHEQSTGRGTSARSMAIRLPRSATPRRASPGSAPA